MYIEKFTIVQVTFAVIQFGLFLAILLLEIFVTFSDHINRWIAAILMLIFSFIVLLSACIRKIRDYMPILDRGYKVGLSVMIAGALCYGESFFEVRTIISYIIVGVSIVYIILCGVFQPKAEEMDDLNYIPQSNFDHVEANRLSSVQNQQSNIPPS